MSEPLVDAGRLVKMEVDYSSTCDEKIPECQKMATAGQLNEALETLLSLEKQARTVIYIQTVTVGCPIIGQCTNKLNSHVIFLHFIDFNNTF
jgi:26S proteasome regulatory subunit N5